MSLLLILYAQLTNASTGSGTGLSRSPGPLSTFKMKQAALHLPQLGLSLSNRHHDLDKVHRTERHREGDERKLGVALEAD
jgi:hypothetical protein